MVRDAIYASVDLALYKFSYFIIGSERMEEAADWGLSRRALNDASLATTRPSSAMLKLSVYLERADAMDSYTRTQFALKYEPKRSVVMNSISTLLREVMNAGCCVTSFLADPELFELLTPIATEIEGLGCEDRVYQSSDNSVHVMASFCRDIFSSDLDRCKTELDQYRRLCSQADKNLAFQTSTSLATLSAMSLENVSAELTRLEEEMAFVKLIPHVVQVGIFQLDMFLAIKKAT